METAGFCCRNSAMMGAICNCANSGGAVIFSRRNFFLVAQRRALGLPDLRKDAHQGVVIGNAGLGQHDIAG